GLLLPVRVVRRQAAVQVGGGEPLEQRHPGRVLVRRLGGLVAGDPAEGVLRPVEGEQVRGAGGVVVDVGEPVGPAGGQRGPVVVPGGRERRGGARGGVRTHEGQGPDGGRGQIVAQPG